MTSRFMFGRSFPTVMLHAILDPLNVYRLAEIYSELIKQFEAASTATWTWIGSSRS